MDITIQKTISFILFILIGILLKLKFSSKEEVNGIKKIILNLALPATIFIALLGVKVTPQLIVLPFLALALNFLLYYSFPIFLPILGIKKNTPKYRTSRLLLASLAPGLSCFPFVLEFLGEMYLAKAAMADLGNKVFVLIFLYSIAMNWYGQQHRISPQKNKSKIKSLVMALAFEPVNVFILAALILLFFGFSLATLPVFITDTLSKLSVIMTPLVLLFIGLTVDIKRKDFFKLLSLLIIRAGIVVLSIGFFITIAEITIPNDILLALTFGLSACSFWPFAHISSISAKEADLPKKLKTFDTRFAVNILALSFPFSTLLIVGVFSSGDTFSNTYAIFLLGGVLLFLGLIPFFLKKIPSFMNTTLKSKLKWFRFKTTATEQL